MIVIIIGFVLFLLFWALIAGGASEDEAYDRAFKVWEAQQLAKITAEVQPVESENQHACVR